MMGILTIKPGWWLTYVDLPLWKILAQVSWDDYSIPNCFWKVIQNSMVPVTTNQEPMWFLPARCWAKPRLFLSGIAVGEDIPLRFSRDEHRRETDEPWRNQVTLTNLAFNPISSNKDNQTFQSFHVEGPSISYLNIFWTYFEDISTRFCHVFRRLEPSKSFVSENPVPASLPALEGLGEGLSRAWLVVLVKIPT